MFKSQFHVLASTNKSYKKNNLTGVEGRNPMLLGGSPLGKFFLLELAFIS